MRLSRFIMIIVLTGSMLQAQQPEKLTLAVSDFTPQGVKESDAAVVSEQLRVELSKNSSIRLVERGQMQEILKEQGFQQSGCTNDACAVEVGQLLGVKKMVVGSVGSAGSFTFLTIRLIDVVTGTIIFNDAVRTKGGIDKLIVSGVSEAVMKLNRSMFPDESTDQASKRKPKIGRALLIGGVSTAVIGGGVAAGIYLSKRSTSTTEQNYTEIYLP